MAKDMYLMKWTDRLFHFGYSNDFIPFLVERLLATPPRIEELICYSNDQDLSSKSAGKWSIKEQIGHLTDLEELHSGRLDDFKNRLDTLRPADMTNRKTDEATHNERETAQLCTGLRLSRNAFIEKLRSLDEATLQHRALHPRLQQRVNIADILYFVGEHDNHHLTYISALLAR